MLSEAIVHAADAAAVLARCGDAGCSTACIGDMRSPAHNFCHLRPAVPVASRLSSLKTRGALARRWLSAHVDFARAVTVVTTGLARLIALFYTIQSVSGNAFDCDDASNVDTFVVSGLVVALVRRTSAFGSLLSPLQHRTAELAERERSVQWRRPLPCRCPMVAAMCDLDGVAFVEGVVMGASAAFRRDL
ncbi:hypothetical protein CUR178_05215 [Leishmania enriettii]|uniref:Uncharacterized protein n=1 Tax=Leishmania enriettii TaxID=5663 RepID=A0A836GLU5_LEIEN|nr:hypothetical protein CUR178_05215 [Leishmania enriettii]